MSADSNALSQHLKVLCELKESAAKSGIKIDAEPDCSLIAPFLSYAFSEQLYDAEKWAGTSPFQHELTEPVLDILDTAEFTDKAKQSVKDHLLPKLMDAYKNEGEYPDYCEPCVANCHLSVTFYSTISVYRNIEDKPDYLPENTHERALMLPIATTSSVIEIAGYILCLSMLSQVGFAWSAQWTVEDETKLPISEQFRLMKPMGNTTSAGKLNIEWVKATGERSR